MIVITQRLIQCCTKVHLIDFNDHLSIFITCLSLKVNTKL